MSTEVMGGVAGTVLDLVGNTPIVRLRKIPSADGASVLAKLEYFNPCGSVKDRICLSMIEDAEQRGALKPGGTVVEPTSGNTGIGLAMVCAVKGYRLILTMPETMSEERRTILRNFGAELVLTPGAEGMTGAVLKAEDIVLSTDGAFMPQQFLNEANPRIHRETTAKEIIKAIDGELHAFVSGVGTGGTITGVGETLKQHYSKLRVVAVEPDASPVLSGGDAGPHKIQGIGAGFVPGVLNRDVIDDVIRVADDDAYQMAARLTKEEGLFVGISAGAACVAAIQVAAQLPSDQQVLTVLPDTGERYLSMEPYFNV